MAEPSPPPQFIVTEVKTWVPDDRSWLARSKPLTDLTPAIGFALRETVYTGDPNDGAQFKDPAFNPKIDLPTFPRRNALRATATEVRGHEDELAAYYRRIMDLTGPNPLARKSNYWLILKLESLTASVEIGFAWWDRLADMAEFFAWLRTAESGRGFIDQDQGWMIRAFRDGERLHVLDSDPDDGDREHANVSVDRATFLARLDETETAARDVITKLRDRLSIDPWS